MKYKAFLTIALLCLLVQSAWAWNGSGTSADPYLIKSSAGLVTGSSELSRWTLYCLSSLKNNNVQRTLVAVQRKSSNFARNIDAPLRG